MNRVLTVPGDSRKTEINRGIVVPGVDRAGKPLVRREGTGKWTQQIKRDEKRARGSSGEQWKWGPKHGSTVLSHLLFEVLKTYFILYTPSSMGRTHLRKPREKRMDTPVGGAT